MGREGDSQTGRERQGRTYATGCRPDPPGMQGSARSLASGPPQKGGLQKKNLSAAQSEATPSEV